ncbi:hypothetical protein UA08_00192 [Talaromyces atroroseus]|uniref:NmrA-like domain-containing protein n=1 Tax=Talaromyces atroroseus TaxID=1441469 RepID=A0A225AU28_TALAT|nr:hypothetical protein UA08_00192 [Talaromyces atroroseus]OKL64440.1 hypothetical protein UA08_00192 [Talaromyces atroroseus]
MPKYLLITGATGKQGGGVIDALIREDADFEILAVTRDTSSSRAQKLKQKSASIQLIEGDLDQPDEIFTNAEKVISQPIWGVFSVQVPVPSGLKHDSEERQGKGLIDAALQKNVKCFVYTSVDRGGEASFDNPTPIPHFSSKHYIEHHLVKKAKGTDMAWTILRPTAFLENFTPNFFVSDIGFFGAQAFLHPNQYQNKCISLAGDELSYSEMAMIFHAKCGRDVPLTFDFVGRILMWMMKDLGYMFQWFYDSGYKADIPALKKIKPDLKDFKTGLKMTAVL